MCVRKLCVCQKAESEKKERVERKDNCSVDMYKRKRGLFVSVLVECGFMDMYRGVFEIL